MPCLFLRMYEDLQEAYATLKNFIKPVFSTNDSLDNLDDLTIKSNDFNSSFDNQLNILSWNVYRGYNIHEFKKSLRELIDDNNYSLIVLQEAPLHDEPFWNDFKFNAFYAPFHQVKKQTRLYPYISSGQLILSKYKFTKNYVFEIPTVTSYEVGPNHSTKRIVTYAQIVNRKQSIGIYNVHLENACDANSRGKEIEVLLNEVEKNNDDLVVLAGDFNMFLGKRFEK